MATLAVALGAGFGLASGDHRRSLRALRWFALVLALVVVFGHLLPEAVHELGWAMTALVFLAGLALPVGVERVFHRRRGGHALGLELGFWGLMVHHVGDGLALGAYARLGEHHGAHGGAAHFDGGHLDVVFALVVHTVPLVAVVAAAYAQREGRRAAVWRCAGFAVASAVGIFAASGFDAEAVEAFHTWIAAAVSGLLLHIATHDLGLPRLWRWRRR